MNAGLEHLPPIVSLLLFAAVANAAAFFGYEIVRVFGMRRGIQDGTAAAGTWASIVGSLLAVLFAFTIVNLWGFDRQMTATVDQEAVSLRMIAREIQPAQVARVREYIDATVAEWPQLCDGSSFARSDAALSALIGSSARSAAHEDDLYRQIAQLDSLRAQRVRASKTTMPLELWISLIGLSLLLLFSLAFVFVEHRVYQAALMSLTATSIAMLFWLASLLDFPFCGGTSVSPQPILDALQYLH